MKTIEHLNRVAHALKSVTTHDIQVYEDEGRIDVNFDYRQAVVIEPQLLVGRGLRWSVMALAWDQTGGVSAEKELGEVTEEVLPAVVKMFLDRRDAESAYLERLMSDNLEDI